MALIKAAGRDGRPFKAAGRDRRPTAKVSLGASRADLPTRIRQWDAVTLLTIYVVALLGLPSRYIIGPLGGAGTPAMVLGMACGAWWVAHRVMRARYVPEVSQPVRTAMLIFVAAILASYVAAATRPIGAGEMRAADLGLLVIWGWLGVFLVATDGVPSRQRLDTLLRRVAIGGGLVAALGVAQFWTGMAFTNYLQLPGLTVNADLRSLAERDGYVRPAGTALHPIEFGVVLTALLPLALHFALEDKHRKLWRRWFPVLAICLAVPISVSRSAILCTVVVLLFLIPTWPKARRRGAALFGLALTGVVFVTIPGMLGTLSGMFTNIASDSSALSRTGSYDMAWEFIQRAPLFGRGFGTFLPAYRILDNQYLLTVIETGLVGLAAVLALFITAMVVAKRIRRATDDPLTRSLAQSLSASVAAVAFGMALFDGFSFPMVVGLAFLCLGCIGALRRLTLGSGVPPKAPAPAAGPPPPG